MALYDLSDRLNWQQACEILGCSKTHLYRLVRERFPYTEQENGIGGFPVKIWNIFLQKDFPNE